MIQDYADLIETLRGTRSSFEAVLARIASQPAERVALEHLCDMAALHAQMGRQFEAAMVDHRARAHDHADIDQLFVFF